MTGHGGDISSMNSGILRRLKERCLSNAKMITVVSKYKQQELERLYPGYQNEIISMGVDTTLFEKKQIMCKIILDKTIRMLSYMLADLRKLRVYII